MILRGLSSIEVVRIGFLKVVENYLISSFLSFACSRETTRRQSTHHLRIGLYERTPVPHLWHLIMNLPLACNKVVL